MIYALPTWDILQAMSRWNWVECGAGTGLWLRIMREYGIDSVAYDIEPRGDGVIRGDHTNLAKHADRALLIVWPPDSARISDWIAAHGGTHVAICDDWGRFLKPVPNFQILHHWKIMGGQKGDSDFKLMKVR